MAGKRLASIPTRRFSAEHNVGPYKFQIKALSALARLRLLNAPVVRLRRLNPRRLDFILDMKFVTEEPATLGKALCRQYLVYPLASFDISGQ
jgi:hypothetical protein